MIRKIMDIFVIMLLIATALSTLVMGNESHANDNKLLLNIIEPDDYVTSSISIDKSSKNSVLSMDPLIVVITSPHDGAIVNDPNLSILGYATTFSNEEKIIGIQWSIVWDSGRYDDPYDPIPSYNSLEFTINIYGIFPGENTVIVTFYNNFEESANDSVTFTYVPTYNEPPDNPSTPYGLASGNTGTSYSYSTNTIDPDGDTVKYGWDWNGDGTIDEWTGFYSSGTAIITDHKWTTEGTYNIKVKSEDSHGAQSGFSSSKTVVISDANPPNKPNTPSGSTSGKSGNSYSYSTYTTDPNGDQVYYLFDWDDNMDSGWVGPYNSGQIASISHIWTAQGSYSIKVKAKDDPNGDGDLSDGTESSWSDPLSISMPKNKAISTPFLNFMEKHPYLFPLLLQLLDL